MVGRRKVYMARGRPVIQSKMLNIFRYFRERKERKLREKKEVEVKRLNWIEELGRREKEVSERNWKEQKTLFDKHSQEIKLAISIRDSWNNTPELVKERARHLAEEYISLPSSCFLCNEIKDLIRHHQDYFKPLEIIPLCLSCHSHIHAYNGFKRSHLDYIIAIEKKLGHI